MLHLSTVKCTETLMLNLKNLQKMFKESRTKLESQNQNTTTQAMEFKARSYPQ